VSGGPEASAAPLRTIGPADVLGYVVSGYMVVVQAEVSEWKSPFHLRRDGKSFWKAARPT